MLKLKKWQIGIVVAAFAIVVVAVWIVVSGSFEEDETGQKTTPNGVTQTAYTGKKVLWVNSYHQGYEWSDGIEQGIRSVLDGTGAELKIAWLDSKNKPDEASIQAAASQTLAEIDEFQPDVIIASDDNAQKYLVVPYLMDTEQPVVFCGLNWDASIYGYPTENITGMVEIELVAELVDHLKQYSAGDTIGYLTVTSETETKVIKAYNERFFDGQMQVVEVKTFDEFKDAFLEVQDKWDMVFLGNNAGIDRWDVDEAEQFFVANTKVPTGTINSWMAPYALITLAKDPAEQGEWSAQAALQILDGTPPSEIPVVENQRGSLILHLDIAEQLDVVFPPATLRNAEVYSSEKEQEEGS